MDSLLQAEWAVWGEKFHRQNPEWCTEGAAVVDLGGEGEGMVGRWGLLCRSKESGCNAAGNREFCGILRGAVTWLDLVSDFSGSTIVGKEL